MVIVSTGPVGGTKILNFFPALSTLKKTESGLPLIICRSFSWLSLYLGVAAKNRSSPVVLSTTLKLIFGNTVAINGHGPHLLVEFDVQPGASAESSARAAIEVSSDLIFVDLPLAGFNTTVKTE